MAIERYLGPMDPINNKDNHTDDRETRSIEGTRQAGEPDAGTIADAPISSEQLWRASAAQDKANGIMGESDATRKHRMAVEEAENTAGSVDNFFKQNSGRQSLPQPHVERPNPQLTRVLEQVRDIVNNVSDSDNPQPQATQPEAQQPAASLRPKFWQRLFPPRNEQKSA